MDGLDLSAILDTPQSVVLSEGQTAESSEEVTPNGEEQD